MCEVGNEKHNHKIGTDKNRQITRASQKRRKDFVCIHKKNTRGEIECR